MCIIDVLRESSLSESSMRKENVASQNTKRQIIAMTETQQSPLNWEASATATHPQVSSSLPIEVEACLKNARFVRFHAPKSLWMILIT